MPIYECMCAQSCLTLCDPWTVAHQTPLSMKFSRQEYFGGLSFPTWLCPVYLPNIPGFYTILFFTTSDFTFTTRHIHNWVSFPLWPSASLILELLVISLCSSPVSYWTFSDLGRLIFQCHIFLHFHTGHGFPDKHTGVVCHFLIQWTMFCQNSSLWPSILGSPAWKGS